MNSNLLRVVILFFSVLLLLCLGVFAYGSYKNTLQDTADCCIEKNNRNSEMPWEALSRNLVGAVGL